MHPGPLYYWSKNSSVATTMGRPLRVAPGELIYHVLNRANGRPRLFDDDSDYRAVERVMTQACDRVSMRLLAYCVMPTTGILSSGPDTTAISRAS
jgi:hypothetical protein